VPLNQDIPILSNKVNEAAKTITIIQKLASKAIISISGAGWVWITKANPTMHIIEDMNPFLADLFRLLFRRSPAFALSILIAGLSSFPLFNYRRENKLLK